MVLDKFARALKIITWNGGIVKSLKKLYLDDKTVGTLGKTVIPVRSLSCSLFDLAYSRRASIMYKDVWKGRNRWVEYNPKVGLNYDASQIPAEWFGWLHYRTDELPCQDLTRPRYCWMLKHEPNVSGTPYQYVPYDTTRAKIEAWKPPKKS